MLWEKVIISIRSKGNIISSVPIILRWDVCSVPDLRIFTGPMKRRVLVRKKVWVLRVPGVWIICHSGSLYLKMDSNSNFPNREITVWDAPLFIKEELWIFLTATGGDSLCSISCRKDAQLVFHLLPGKMDGLISVFPEIWDVLR